MKKIYWAIGLVLFLVFYIHSTPLRCETVSVTVLPNDSIHDVATSLDDQKCLRSKTLFEKYGVLFDVQVLQGTYSIEAPKSFFGYLFAFEGTRYKKVVRMTIPEGSTNREISALCAELLPACDSKKFLELAKDKEGFLFPNTYNFIGTETASVVIERLHKEFQEKTASIFQDLSTAEQNDIVILASILEKEANTKEDMHIIAGILERRLAIGMPLQVDATLFYERRKTSAQLSTRDLQTDSPFNTYTNIGLPPHPIGNPGIVAIQAVLEAQKTPYLFYLTGKDGNMYYARTHDEHVQNKLLYLR